MPQESMSDFVSTHKGLVVGGGVVAVLVIGGIMMRNKASVNTPASSASDLSGLTNGIVYVPTQTSFTTENVGADFSNDPNLTSIKTGNITTNSPTSSSSTTNNTKLPPTGPGNHKKPGEPDGDKGKPPDKKNHPPSRKPPVKPPAPKPSTKGLKWDQGYSIRGGETLSLIAATLTRKLRAQGMPGSMSVTWHDLYAHNTQVINATSASHHNPIPGGPWNDVFPGEHITVPRWA